MRKAVALLALILGAAAYAQSVYDTVLQRKQDAGDKYLQCRDTGGPCTREWEEYIAASDALHEVILSDVRSNLLLIQTIESDLRDITSNRLATCGRSKHWWQIWKRCRP